MRHNLRAAVVERFGTQLECAGKTGIHITRLNRIIRGWVEPTLIERDRLASALGADSQWLFSVITRIPAPTGSAISEDPVCGRVRSQEGGPEGRKADVR